MLIVSAALFWDGKEYIAGGPFGASLLFFVIALIASVVLMESKN